MENYLQKKHAEHYMGTDDEMPDAFDAWMLDLDVAEWIELSNDYCIKGTGTTETTLEEILDKFMIKWCGENAKHLIDSDDNDGERLRAKIKSFVALAVQQERERMWKDYKTQEKMHKMMLDSLSCMSIEDFVVWRDERIKSINQDHE